MVDDVPSPAGRPSRPPSSAERSGLTTLPWESAFYQALRRLEAERDQLKRERAEQALVISQLHSKLRHARTQLENWRLRHDAWRHERAELLARLPRR